MYAEGQLPLFRLINCSVVFSKLILMCESKFEPGCGSDVSLRAVVKDWGNVPIPVSE